jgi:hypothetical protein
VEGVSDAGEFTAGAFAVSWSAAETRRSGDSERNYGIWPKLTEWFLARDRNSSHESFGLRELHGFSKSASSVKSAPSVVNIPVASGDPFWFSWTDLPVSELAADGGRIFRTGG